LTLLQFRQCKHHGPPFDIRILVVGAIEDNADLLDELLDMVLAEIPMPAAIRGRS